MLNKISRIKSFPIDSATIAAFLVLTLFVGLILLQVFSEPVHQRRLHRDLSKLRGLYLALKNYSLDNNGVLPPMKSPQQMQQALFPDYVKSREEFVEEATQRPFQPNPLLSGRKVSSLDKQAEETIAAYGAPRNDWGKRYVVFLDGTVKTMDESEWQQLRKEAGIP